MTTTTQPPTEQTSTNRWTNGLGSQSEYLKLKNKFLKHLKQEEQEENHQKRSQTAGNSSATENVENYTFQQAPRPIEASTGASDVRKSTHFSKRRTKASRASHETVAQSLEKSRQSRILNRHQKRQKHWNSLTNHLSQKLSQKPHQLLLHRSEREYRQKVEEVELMEAAKEMRALDKSKRNKTEMTSPFAWQMSLRDADEMMVPIGGQWPYPLYVPVRKKRGLASKRRQQIIRKMTLKEELGADHEEDEELGNTVRESILGVRTMENHYAKKNYRHELKKVLTDHDAVEYVGGLRVKGVGVSTPAKRSTTNEEEEEGEELYSPTGEEETGQPSSRGTTTTSEQDKSDRFPPEVQGPGYRISQSEIAFGTVPEEITYSSVTVRNIGSCALQYKWQKKDPITTLQTERAATKFQLTSPSKGVLHPGTETQFFFSFKSKEEGIFSVAYVFSTIPVFAEQASSVVELRGVTIAPKDESKFLPFAQNFQHEVLRVQMQNAVNMLLDALPEPEEPPSDAEERAARKRALLQQRFKEQNPNIDYVSDEIVHSFVQFSKHVLNLSLTTSAEDAEISGDEKAEQEQQQELESTPENSEENQPADNDTVPPASPAKEWDFSVASLKILIQQSSVDEETKGELLSVLHDLIQTTHAIPEASEHNRQHTPILTNDSLLSSLQSRLRYFAISDSLYDAVDQICEASNFVALRYTTDPKAAGKGKGKGAKKGAPAVEEEDEETAKKRTQEAKERQTFAQARDAVSNCLHAALDLFVESEEEISAFC